MGSAIVFNTVWALAVVGHKTVVVAHCPDDDAVAGSEDDDYLTLFLRTQDDVFCSTIVVAGGFQMPHTADYRRLYFAEMTRIA